MAKKVTAKKPVKTKAEDCCTHKKRSGKECGGGSAFYFVGFIGAVVYYLSNAQTFLGGLWGVVKALVWPAFLVFELMKYLGM